MNVKKCNEKKHLQVAFWTYCAAKVAFLISEWELLGLLAKIEVFCILPAHWPLILDAGIILVSVHPLICSGFVYCHWTGRWEVLENTH